MQKNDIITVKIEDIGANGEGIGKADGYTLFIKDAVIGDVIEAKIMKAKKNYGYARLMSVIKPSEYRVNTGLRILYVRLPENAVDVRFRRWNMEGSFSSRKRR